MMLVIVPKPITDFSVARLNGWKNNRLVVSKSPHPQLLDFLFESMVLHNWRTQEPCRYTNGFIQFRNRVKFDRHNQTIDGNRVYLFDYREVSIYWSIFIELRRLAALVNMLNDVDICSFSALLNEVVDGRPNPIKFLLPRSWSERHISERLVAVGLSQLRSLSEMLEVGEQAVVKDAA